MSALSHCSSAEVRPILYPTLACCLLALVAVFLPITNAHAQGSTCSTGDYTVTVFPPRLGSNVEMRVDGTIPTSLVRTFGVPLTMDTLEVLGVVGATDEETADNLRGAATSICRILDADPLFVHDNNVEITDAGVFGRLWVLADRGAALGCLVFCDNCADGASAATTELRYEGHLFEGCLYPLGISLGKVFVDRDRSDDYELRVSVSDSGHCPLEFFHGDYELDFEPPPQGGLCPKLKYKGSSGDINCQAWVTSGQFTGHVGSISVDCQHNLHSSDNAMRFALLSEDAGATWQNKYSTVNCHFDLSVSAPLVTP